MANVLVIAPHPDDETLGCGGTLLKHQQAGDAVHWLIVTSMDASLGFSQEQIKQRQNDIERVNRHYQFAGVHQLGLPTTTLDTLPMNQVVGAMKEVFSAVEPEVVYLPFSGDAHTDHGVVFRAGAACSKWFRAPSLKEILCYEVISETEFQFDPTEATFNPNVYSDITELQDRKQQALEIYAGEMGEFPFPRSLETSHLLAKKRGSEAGVQSAEAFMCLWQKR